MNFGFSGEMLFVVLLALIIFGPRKLPEIGRQIGKALAEFRRASNEFKSQLEAEMRQIEIEEALKKEKEQLTPTILPPDGTVTADSASPAAGTVAAPSASLPASETEPGPDAESKSEPQNKLPEMKEPEVTSEALKSVNG